MKLFYYLFFASILILSWSCEEKNNIADVEDQNKTDSLRQDSIKKANEINLVGKWNFTSFAGNEMEAGVMQMIFTADNAVQIITHKNTHEGEYKLDQENKIISVIEDKKPEEWLIKSYSLNEIVLETEDKEEKIDIILKRVKSPQKDPAEENDQSEKDNSSSN